MNESKLKQKRWLRKWQLSGSMQCGVNPTNPVKVDALVHHYAYDCKGYDTVSCIVTETHRKQYTYFMAKTGRYNLGDVINTTPKGICAVETFGFR